MRADLWSKGIMKPLVVPGGVVLLAALILLQAGLVPVSAPAISFYYYAVFGAGVLLAWRFHSSRVLFALLTLFLAGQAVEFFSRLRPPSASGAIALEAVALLLPLNFVIASVMRERGIVASALASKAALLFFESVFVAVICRPGASAAPAFLHPGLLGSGMFEWSRIPQFGWLAFLAAVALLLGRFLVYRKPVESGLLWSLAAMFLGLQAGTGRVATGYAGTAALILASSIIENSYALAFHDELTGLPARRAFNDALFRLGDCYTVAVVDIDHFKKFNDTYGHETGDHVLRMVAARLAHVSGGGMAYRVGGEEFTILFPGVSLANALPHLELLRTEVEAASFRVRDGQERRKGALTRPDRRRPVRQRRLARSGEPPLRSATEDLSVTVSIGVAEPSAKNQTVDRVIHSADQALYRAKGAGRNRVESTAKARPRRAKRDIA
jgi:diguanylate cyclase (GGDEF)-like protein